MMTRIRLTFTKQAALRYIGHLDMVKTWERILRRAGLPLAYSQGFHPQPKVQFASALPVGCASLAEVMDVVFAQALSPEAVQQALEPQLPPGLRVVDACEVALNAAALQATLQSAEYVLTVQTPEPAEAIGQRAQALLDAPALARQRRGKTYDLRRLILDARLLDSEEVGAWDALGSEKPAEDPYIHLWAHLCASQAEGSGRPDELLDALGLADAPAEVCRTRLNFGM